MEPAPAAAALAPKSDLSKKRRNVSRSKRAKLTLPVGRVARLLKDGNVASRISGSSAVFLTAVLQYMTAEVIALAGATAQGHSHKKITPRYIQLAVRSDDELRELLGSVTIGEGGVLPTRG